jgi:hypothetical protein
MKFLIIAKPLNKASKPNLGPDIAEQCRRHLSDLKKAILDEAYICEDGGVAFGINADSFEEVALESRQHDISMHAHIDIYPVSCFQTQPGVRAETTSKDKNYEPTAGSNG